MLPLDGASLQVCHLGNVCLCWSLYLIFFILIMTKWRNVETCDKYEEASTCNFQNTKNGHIIVCVVVGGVMPKNHNNRSTNAWIRRVASYVDCGAVSCWSGCFVDPQSALGPPKSHYLTRPFGSVVLYMCQTSPPPPVVLKWLAVVCSLCALELSHGRSLLQVSRVSVSI